jgi:hypothetical protein
MNTKDLSNDMRLAIRDMHERGRSSPSKSGLYVRTFRALVSRGLAELRTEGDFFLTGEGKKIAKKLPS